MRGQIIEKQKGVFLVRIETRKSGKRETLFSRTVKGKKSDANKLLTEKLAELDKGVLVKDSKQTLNEYLDFWLESIAKPRLHPRTFGDYKDIVRLYIRESLGSIKLGELRAVHIQKLYGEMQTKRGLSPRRIRYTHSILSSALKKACELDILPRNVCQFVQLPKQTRREIDVLTQDECADFLKALEGKRLAAMFSFALATGTRPEEYLALKWSDIDFEKGTAIIRRALIINRTGGGWHFNEPKTKQSRRTIPLPVSVLTELKSHRKEQLAERLKLGAAWNDLDLVFSSEIGTPLSAQNITQRIFKPALKRAGIRESIRLYDLRHTCATLLLQAGENPKVVSERLGHSNITLTLDVYSHVLPTMQKAATEKLEQLLFRS